MHRWMVIHVCQKFFFSLSSVFLKMWLSWSLFQYSCVLLTENFGSLSVALMILPLPSLEFMPESSISSAVNASVWAGCLGNNYISFLLVTLRLLLGPSELVYYWLELFRQHQQTSRSYANPVTLQFFPLIIYTVIYKICCSTFKHIEDPLCHCKFHSNSQHMHSYSVHKHW